MKLLGRKSKTKNNKYLSHLPEEVKLTTAEKTKNEILEVLRMVEAHMAVVDGPYGSFIAVPAQGGLKLTKDGANVLKALIVSRQNAGCSVLERFVLEQIHMFTKAIEQEVGDGTTSATRIACAYLGNLLSMPGLDTVNTDLQIYRGMVEKIKYLIKPSPITLYPNELDAAQFGKYVHAQTYTSSHGNLELCPFIQTMIQRVPRGKEYWNKLAIIADPTKKEEYSLKFSTEELMLLDYRPGLPSMYNSGSSNTIYTEGARIVLVGQMTPDETAELLKTMTDSPDTTWYLVGDNVSNCVAPFISGRLKGGMFSPMTQISAQIDTYAVYSAYKDSAEGVQVKGYTVLDSSATLRFEDGVLTISGIFKYDDRGVNIAYTKDSRFHKLMTVMAEQNNRQSIPPAMGRRLSTLIASSMFQISPILYLGGNIDVLNRNLDIIEDTIFSLGIGTEHGIVCGSNATFFHVVCRTKDDLLCFNDEDAMMKQQWVENLRLAIKTIHPELDGQCTCQDVITGDITCICHPLKGKEIIQPQTGITTFLTAFEHHLLRLLYLDRVLV